MRDFEKILSEFKENVVEVGSDGAAFEFHLQGALIMWVVVSFGDGWDHVSVTLNRERCPKWSEMCMVKEMFLGLMVFASKPRAVKLAYVGSAAGAFADA